jgi:hypothetical protein
MTLGAMLCACTEDVIVGEDVVVPQPLDGLRKVPQCHRIAAYFCLWKYDSEFHRVFAPFVLVEYAVSFLRRRISLGRASVRGKATVNR